jgi:uncharacterized protein YuzE
MREFRVKYDDPSDTLSIIFESGIKSVMSILLGEHLLVRVDRNQEKVVTIEIMNYSILSRTTAMGMPSFPLPELLKLSQVHQNLICDVLLSDPVNRFLNLSAYFVDESAPIPIVFFKAVAQAA